MVCDFLTIRVVRNTRLHCIKNQSQFVTVSLKDTDFADVFRERFPEIPFSPFVAVKISHVERHTSPAF